MFDGHVYSLSFTLLLCLLLLYVGHGLCAFTSDQNCVINNPAYLSVQECISRVLVANVDVKVSDGNINVGLSKN